MSGLSRAHIVEAEHRIRPYIRRTPILQVPVPTPFGPRDVSFKLEQTQLGGSFKARGILNMALRAREQQALPAAGLVIASGGNAGIAAAVAGRALKSPITVVVPHDAPSGKVAKLRALGARIMDGAADHTQSNSWADQFANQTGALRLHAYDHRDVVAGAATIVTEALEQQSDIDSVLVAVGGGGLLAGCVAATQGTKIRVVGVEPAGAPTLRVALEAGQRVHTEVDTIARDSLGARMIGKVPWDVCSRANIESLLVSDSAISTAQEWLWSEYRLLVEHAAACAIAALREGVWVARPNSKPLIVLCGANVENP